MFVKILRRIAEGSKHNDLAVAVIDRVATFILNHLAQSLQLGITIWINLAQAQKLLGTANIEKVSGFVGSLAQLDPKVLDKFDADEAVDTYADMHGINPNIIRNKDQVAQLRDVRAKQQKAAQMAAMAKPMKEMAQAGKAMGETDQNNLGDMVAGLTGASR